ncbi:ParB/RepB/Spo0J family partition protein [Streptomyces sp. ISL-98]|uniref:ParB/RepB/Spo0J family partition protein n=1 Tax=Streptomyces sp. ISL-98 TaxID=2819192 RepID=UPI0027E4BEEA|nr:ParB/RepB/Spo0J family partition protein [Streptomyces sp. ISL-98]
MARGEAEMDEQPVVEVELSSLSLAGSPRLSGERPEHVQLLAAAQNALPPIVVHRATMTVIDGFHRLRAARLRGDDKIAVQFFDGDEAEAFVLAVRLNVTHGLPLALADRKRAAERIIASHPQWSDRRVASVTGISPGTVADIRKWAVRESETHDRRIGQDGRLRPLDSSVGRMLAGELLTANPNLSLRQVGRAAGISPETARDVRNRLCNGDSLLPEPRRRKTSAVAGAVVATTGTVAGTGRSGSPVRGRDFGGQTRVRRPGRPQGERAADHAALVTRLKADPALRFSDTGRNLLRLMAVHTLRKEEWEAIINNIPPHCSDIVADLAQQFAALWSEFAARIQDDVPQTG